MEVNRNAAGLFGCICVVGVLLVAGIVLAIGAANLFDLGPSRAAQRLQAQSEVIRSEAILVDARTDRIAERNVHRETMFAYLLVALDDGGMEPTDLILYAFGALGLAAFALLTGYGLGWSGLLDGLVKAPQIGPQGQIHPEE